MQNYPQRGQTGPPHTNVRPMVFPTMFQQFGRPPIPYEILLAQQRLNLPNPLSPQFPVQPVMYSPQIPVYSPPMQLQYNNLPTEIQPPSNYRPKESNSRKRANYGQYNHSSANDDSDRASTSRYGQPRHDNQSYGSKQNKKRSGRNEEIPQNAQDTQEIHQDYSSIPSDATGMHTVQVENQSFKVLFGTNEEEVQKWRHERQNKFPTLDGTHAMISINSGHAQSKRKKVCKYFLRGGCRNGDNCMYLHQLPEKKNNRRHKEVPTIDKAMEEETNKILLCLRHIVRRNFLSEEKSDVEISEK